MILALALSLMTPLLAEQAPEPPPAVVYPAGDSTIHANGTAGVEAELNSSKPVYRADEPVLISLGLKNLGKEDRLIECGYPPRVFIDILVMTSAGATVERTPNWRGYSFGSAGLHPQTAPAEVRTCYSNAALTGWGYHLGPGTYVMQALINRTAPNIVFDSRFWSNMIEITVTP